MTKKKSNLEKVGDVVLFAILLYLILCIWSFILREVVTPIKNGDYSIIYIWLITFIITYFIMTYL